ncbi:MAG TPA: ABC transporter permease [Pirellulales bacterium]
MAVPLARKNLTHNPWKLVVSVLGIGFAVLLMCMQLGFYNALRDSPAALLRHFDCDLVITSRTQYALVVPQQFNHRRLAQALACTGVKSVRPLYVGPGAWKLPEADALRMGAKQGTGAPKPRRRTTRPIRVIACDMSDPPLDFPGVKEHQAELQEIGAVLFDSASTDASTGSREMFGQPQIGTETTLGGTPVRVVGHFRLGKDFATDGNVITSSRTMARIRAPLFPPGADPLSMVDIGLVKLEPGRNLDEAKAELISRLPDDVLVATHDEFIQREQSFWLKVTPIGKIFTVGVGLGFVVGTIICYQILHAGISQSMSEFATLKAMGYRDSYFYKMVLIQACYLSAMGFIPGVAASYGLYGMVHNATGLDLKLTWSLVGMVMGLTLLMCIASGMLAVRKVFTADPAELFK